MHNFGTPKRCRHKRMSGETEVQVAFPHIGPRWGLAQSSCYVTPADVGPHPNGIPCGK